MSAELRTERRDAVLLLTLSDPATRNALSPALLAAAVETLGIVESDSAVRAVVLTGEGDHFCAGSNLQPWAAQRDAGHALADQHLQLFHQLVETLRTHPKPVIAAVEGAASGSGFSLALACDLIVAAEDARFSMAHGRVGLSPDGAGSWHLARALPRALALELLWLAEPVTARSLQAHGVVNRVTDSGYALTEALRLAAELAAFAPNALASAKELVNEAAHATLTEQLASERRHVGANLRHRNGVEGLQAFLDQRAPRFTAD